MRLIDGDALVQWLKSPTGFSTNCEDCTSIDCLDCIVEEAINNAPTIEAEPVRHGRWEAVTESVWNLQTPVLQGWRCSLCGREEPQKEPYCHCGAKMEEGDE